MNDMKIGKFLSYVLRHHPDAINIKLDKQGYADVQELIQKINATKEYRDTLSKELLDTIVANDTKKRYAYSPDGKRIRAVQGHSFHVDVAKKAVPPVVLYHGTSAKAWQIIRKKGLQKMSRDYVHLSVDVDTAKMVGMRHAKRQNELVILAIDCKKMLADGYNFYIAENGVWLADYVPAKYLTCMNDKDEIS